MMTHSKAYRLATFLAATMTAVVGCGNHVLLGDETGAAGSIGFATGGAINSWNNISTGGATGGATSGSGDISTGGTVAIPNSTDGGNCTTTATCSTPAGPLYTFTSVSDVYSAMVGTWQICPGAGNIFATAPADTIGVEYGPASAQVTANGSTVGGNMYFLVQGPNGPVRGAGFDYQLTYDIPPVGGPDFFQLYMHPDPMSGFVTALRYSPCPRELQIEGDFDTSSSVLVPF